MWVNMWLFRFAVIHNVHPDDLLIPSSFSTARGLFRRCADREFLSRRCVAPPPSAHSPPPPSTPSFEPQTALLRSCQRSRYFLLLFSK